MMSPIVLILALAQVPHQHHTGISSDEYARILNDPSRDKWQKPHEVIEALALKSTDTIADIGAGTGYFTSRFARHASTAYAVDIDSKLLDIAKKDAPPNLVTILAAPDDPHLPAASIDTIFLCDVLHHIDSRPAYYEKLKQALKPNGRIVIVDFHEKKLPVGPPPEMKIAGDKVQAELAEAGFHLSRKWAMLPYQYFYEFRQH